MNTRGVTDHPGAEILIVEDNPSSRKLLSGILTEAGYKIRAAPDAEVALRSITARQPDLVLLDLKLPGMDGVEMCLRLKDDEASRDIPVIFISAMGSANLKISALEAGAVDYITKPFEPAEILARIYTHLSLYRMQRTLATQADELAMHRDQLAELVEVRTAEMQAEHECFVTVMNALEAPVYSADMQTHEIVFINKRMEELYGDIVGKTCWKVLQAGQDGPCAFCTNDKLLDAVGEPAGTQVWEHWNEVLGRVMECRDVAIRWPDGRMVRLQVAVDITERRKIEEERNRMIGLSVDFIGSVDLDGYLKYLNPAWVELLGYTEEELLARPLFDFIHPDDHQRCEAEVDSLAAGNETINFENRYICKDGSQRYISWRATFLPETQLMYCVGHDITERKLVEKERENTLAHLQASIESPKGILILGIDLEYRYLFFNNLHKTGMYETYGTTIAPGNSILDSMPVEKDRMLAKTDFDQALAGNSHISIREYGDSPCRYYETAYDPIKNPNGEIIGATVFSRDITERKQEEAAREVMIQLLETLNVETDLRGMMKNVLRMMWKLSGCDAVGIRLRDGDDFPYFETRGFDTEFVEAENSLCCHDLDGQIARVDIGNPVLDCMCGNILCGRVDPSKEFFTNKGSFISNCTTDLLANTTEEDRQASTRNRCNAEGYESVFLVPLRAGKETFGLLQFNDYHKGCFSPEFIQQIEQLAGNIAISLAHRRAEEALQKASTLSEHYINSVPGLFYVFDEERFVRWNNEWNRITGYTDEELSDLYGPDFFGEQDKANVAEKMLKVFRDGDAEVEADLVTKDGRQIPYLFTGKRVPIDGIDHLVGFSVDITERKRNAEILHQQGQYLAGLNQVANLLLLSSDSVPFQGVVDKLGPVSNASRAYVFMNHRSSDDVLMMSQKAEWCAEGIEPQIDNPILQNLPYDQWMPRWRDTLLQGNAINGQVANLSEKEREVLEPQGIQAILIIPILIDDEFVGFIGFDNCVSSQEWDISEQVLLGTAANDLAQAIRRIRSEVRLRASLSEKEVLLREVHHRVKNNLQVVISLLSLQARKLKGSETFDILRESQDRVRAMALVHETLYQSSDLNNIPMSSYFTRLVNDIKKLHAGDTGPIECEVEADDVVLSIESAVPVGLVANELLTNVFKHAFPDRRQGLVRIVLRDLGDQQMELVVSDDGIEIPVEIDIDRSETLGLQLVNSLVKQQLRGSLETKCDNGTTVNVRFALTER